ncbi:MAG: hypothetical protein RIQ56_215 [Candidatus Parcubacteria bacterium]|jgi:SET domain-containing protein
MHQKYYIRRSKPGKGLGLFARSGMEAGEFVIEYTGKKIPTTVADTLTTKYLFEIDEHWTIDGSDRTNIARYVNHSCMPNCEADVRDGRIFFHALRDIEAEEELTLDYGEEYFDEFIRPLGCKCDACENVEA